mmetsp:Transcript_9774/g.13820  ORF Transcript_9774/g.13820 Transcript_9774/m.13820 type:complete len:423 (+) Transcript_9774:33-1301(+)
MGKKKSKDHPSLQGKKPVNSSRQPPTITTNPGHIKNRLKRSEVYGKYLLQKKQEKRKQRLQRRKEAAELGDEVTIPTQTPRTLENAREHEITTVLPNDVEVLGDELCDEFVDYFQDAQRPKIILTTRPKPSSNLFHFIGDLMRFIPNLFYYPRKHFSIKDICEQASRKNDSNASQQIFTHLMVLSEKSKVCNGMMISHIRPTEAAQCCSTSLAGPTAFFKVSNVVLSKGVPNRGNSTNHVPELVLNGFTTRLGHRVGRFLGSIFPHNAQFRGRQVATFHNQRDYIFVRHHRYIFQEGKEDLVLEKREKEEAQQQQEEQEQEPNETLDKRNHMETDMDMNMDIHDNSQNDNDHPIDNPIDNNNKKKKSHKVKKKTIARLQELGPRFSLKLRWIQEGTFDTQFGEYEWYHKRKEMDINRRKFHL